jgi:hypothetical protein
MFNFDIFECTFPSYIRFQTPLALKEGYIIDDLIYVYRNQLYIFYTIASACIVEKHTSSSSYSILNLNYCIVDENSAENDHNYISSGVDKPEDEASHYDRC